MSEPRVDHILRYGGRCRDCADNFGICEYSGLPCDPDVARKAIKHVLEADEHYHSYYGLTRTTPSPAGGDAELIANAIYLSLDLSAELKDDMARDGEFQKAATAVLEALTRSVEPTEAKERDVLQRQLGFELLSVFKGATTESIDDAVERIMLLVGPRWSASTTGERGHRTSPLT